VLLAVLRGDGLGVVVHVASAVGPVDVVEESEGIGSILLIGDPGDRVELAVDRVPVVIAVDHDEVRVADLRQGIETQCAVEDEPVAVVRLELVKVERRLRRRIDPVHDAVVRSGPLEHLRRGPSEGDANLDENARHQSDQQRSHDGFPVAPHEDARCSTAAPGQLHRTGCERRDRLLLVPRLAR
jgi:hypothetical protein